VSGATASPPGKWVPAVREKWAEDTKRLTSNRCSHVHQAGISGDEQITSAQNRQSLANGPFTAPSSHRSQPAVRRA